MWQCRQHQSGVRFVGYVPKSLWQKYNNCAPIAKKLQEDGFVVVDENKCQIFSSRPTAAEYDKFIRNEMLDKKRSRLANLFSIKGESGNKSRQWWDMMKTHGDKRESKKTSWDLPELSGDKKRKRTNKTIFPNVIGLTQAWSQELVWIFDVDGILFLLAKFHTDMAGACDSANEKELIRDKKNERAKAFCKLEAMNTLFRRKALKDYQSLHHDSLHNNGFIIDPKTSDYELLVVPGSHRFVYDGTVDHVPKKIPVERMVRIILQHNQIFIGLSRMIHAGGKSRGYVIGKNDAVTAKDDEWSGIGPMGVTDISVQYSFHLTGLTNASGHDTGRVGTVGCYELIKGININDDTLPSGVAFDPQYSDKLRTFDAVAREALESFAKVVTNEREQWLQQLFTPNLTRTCTRKKIIS